MAGNTLSDVQIFNNALLRLGISSDYFVNAVDGSDTSQSGSPSQYGLFAGYEYFKTRNEELRAHAWHFAYKRQQLFLAYLNAVASWSGSALSLTLAGVSIVSFTANAALVANSDLQSRTLTLTSTTPPSPSWVGQNISGPGIPVDTVVRGINTQGSSFLVILSREVTSNESGATYYLTPLRVGWMVTSALTPGNVIPSYPTGLQSGTIITAISVSGSTVTLALNLPTTQAGSSVSICLQAQNLIGYWYMYQKPADALRDDYIYVLLPDFVYIWPFSVIHQDFFPSKTEGQYIYTDLDPNNGNPYVGYLAEITDTTLFDPLFTDAFIMRLASKMVFFSTGGDKLKQQFEQEYAILISRAQGYNLIEKDSDIDGNVWWVDRGNP